MLKQNKINILIFLLFLTCGIYAQPDREIQGLEVKLHELEEDTNRVEVLLDLSKKLYKKDKESSKAKHYLETAYQLSLKINYPKGIVKYWDTKGFRHRNKSEYQEALYCHFEAMNMAEKLQLNNTLAMIYNNIGVVYRRLDESQKALDFHLKALKFAEENGQKQSRTMAINSIGNIYLLMENYEQALLYFNKALDLAKESNYKLSQAINYNNIGEVYEFTKAYDKALTFYEKSLKINKELNNNKGKAICYFCIGNVYKHTNDTEKALEFYEKALELDLERGDRYFSSVRYINIGEVHIKLGNTPQAIANLQKGLKIALEIGSKFQVKEAYENFSTLYEKNSSTEEALKYYKLAVQYKDSILNEENNKHIARLQILYDSEKQLREIENLKKDQEAKERNIQKKSWIIFLLILAVAMVSIILLLLFRGYSQRRKVNESLLNNTVEINKQNKLLEQQKAEIESHRDEAESHKKIAEEKNQYLEQAYSVIDAKNRKITRSLGYARRIQQAMLPPAKTIDKYFKDYFILFKPKDIVSGDFYWFDKMDENIYFAAVDCTGHGVPGAFMSFVGFNLLNRALYEEKLTKPSDILNFMHSGIKSTLRKENKRGAVKDGMDIALCKLKFTTYELEYAGALNPLYIIRNNELIEHKADYNQLGEIDEDFFDPFNNKKIKLLPGDNLYIFSDGFMDQFGGPFSKKFLKKRFVNSLLKLSSLSMMEQEQKLTEIYNEWQGENEQVDDVLVIGIKIH